MTDTTLIDRPWIIRKSGGQMYSCPNVATLRKWIAEGRLRREDQISRQGDRWYRLGDSPDLSRYFVKRPFPRPRQRPPDEDEGVLDDMVKSFQRKRLMRNALVTVAGTSLLLIAVGYSVAMLAPPDNPLRAFAEAHGLLPGKELAEEAFAKETELAQKSLARGDLVDHERAEEMLLRARKLKADAPEVDADLALAYASHADALLRLASDEEREAANLTDEAQARLLKSAAARKARAVELTAKGGAALAEVERSGGASIAALRAEVEWARVAGDEARANAARAKLEEALGYKEDALSLTVLARAISPDPDRADSEANASAKERLDRALQLAPSLDRARVHRARIAVARGDLAEAEQELSSVLSGMPSYEEAQRLLDRSRAKAHAESAAVAQVGS